jgi:hypothetical protein
LATWDKNIKSSSKIERVFFRERNTVEQFNPKDNRRKRLAHYNTTLVGGAPSEKDGLFTRKDYLKP